MKKIVSIICCIAVLFMCNCLVVYGKTPATLAIQIEEQAIKKGETVLVKVSLENCAEVCKENYITTMIVEVSVDLEKLNVSKDTVKLLLDPGSGMGFGVAQLKEDKVEMQFLNVSDPLESDTRELFQFYVTAKADMDYLLNALDFSYIAVQDGTLKVSERLEVSEIGLIGGEIVELEQITEEETTTKKTENQNHEEETSKKAEQNTSGSQEKTEGNEVDETKDVGNGSGNSESTEMSTHGSNDNKPDAESDKPNQEDSENQDESGFGEELNSESDVELKDETKDNDETEENVDKTQNKSDESDKDGENTEKDKKNHIIPVILFAGIFVGIVIIYKKNIAELKK